LLLSVHSEIRQFWGWDPHGTGFIVSHLRENENRQFPRNAKNPRFGGFFGASNRLIPKRINLAAVRQGSQTEKDDPCRNKQANPASPDENVLR
jgi:hypothetical protein